MLFLLRSVINLYFERTNMCTHRLLLVEHYFREPYVFEKKFRYKLPYLQKYKVSRSIMNCQILISMLVQSLIIKILSTELNSS